MTEPTDSSNGASQAAKHLFCAHCGTEDERDYGFCDHCGEQVGAPDLVRYSASELGNCQVCSTSNLLRAHNCVGCGVALDEKPLRQAAVRQPDRSVADAAYPDPPEDPGPPPAGERSGDMGQRYRRSTSRERSVTDSIRERVDRWSRADVRGAAQEAKREDYESDEPASEPNDSGNRDAELPPELKRINWGALLLGPIWAIGNRTWVGTILFIPWFFPPSLVLLALFVYVAGSIYLGMQANLWAWRSKKWDSVAHFKRSQQNWAFWGFIVSPVILFVLVTLPRATSG